MNKKYIQYDDEQDELFEDELFHDYHRNRPGSGFNHVIGDVVKVYPNAVLVGAIAASKYIRPPIRPRVTYDVDILLSETDFEAFLADDLPENSLKNLEKYFTDSDTARHSQMHKSTGIYVDFLSTESTPLKKRLIRQILENRKKTTNILRLGDSKIDIVKPEYLIALKLNRYYKIPRTEKGLCDRLDITKILKTLISNSISFSFSGVREFMNKQEITCFKKIYDDVKFEINAEKKLQKDLYRQSMYIIDFEASGLGKESYPIEVAWGDGRHPVTSFLLNPESMNGWTDWDPRSLEFHGIPRDKLIKKGEDPKRIAEIMVKELAGKTLYSDEPRYDNMWKDRLLIDSGYDPRLIRIKNLKYFLNKMIKATSPKMKFTDLLEEFSAKTQIPHRAGPDVSWLFEFVDFVRNTVFDFGP
ncbi:MAG: hypothetical protein HF978_10440 [Desulfobacteraceae bacterium]|nr:hypothetical protein [Desulfobacteraceae bacterium]MBC2755952.1 hypothetical protein [Desulfobacteraceae bacterium]